MSQAPRGEVWSALRIPLHDLGTSVYREVDEKNYCTLQLSQLVDTWDYNRL